MLSRKQLALLSVGTSLSFWDIFNVPYIIDYSAQQFHVPSSSPVANLPLTTEMIGYFLGGATNGLVSTYLGRKKGLVLTMLIIAIGSLIGLSSQDFLELSIAELLIGFGIEGEVAVIPSYVSEMTSASFRGRAVGLVNLGGFLMTLVVGPVAIFLGSGYWRLLFLAGLSMALFSAVFRVTLPESERWNKTRGEKVRISKSIIYFTLVWFFSYFAGYSLFSGTIFSIIDGKGFVNSSLYFTYILYGDPLGVTLSSILNDRIERKWSSSFSNVLSGVAILSWAFLSGLPFLVAGFISMFFQGFKFPTMYAYTSENLNTRVRSLGMGIADGIGHLGGAVGPLLVSLAYSTSPYYAIALMGLVSMISGFMLVKGRKVNGKELEAITEEVKEAEFDH
ncbi:MFS transporter [Sulfuracidifex tepidarius]|nr:MFS transporter [Sulfuracidifex tepidarius]